MRYRVLSGFLLVLFACGEGENSGEQQTSGEAQNSAAGTIAEPPQEEAPAPDSVALPESPAEAPSEGTAPATEVLDLLHAVPTSLTFSSVYHDEVEQGAKLVDGDLSTAWNSRTGDLVGASIEVQIPEGVSLTSIMITAGFTHRRGDSDLFERNHRIARIRVLRDAQEVGIYPLDTGSRTLQSLPVEGPGGRYRLEVVEVLEGSRSDWRETCISEMRFMGSAPGAVAGSREPEILIGSNASGTDAPDANGADSNELSAAGATELQALIERKLSIAYEGDELSNFRFAELGTTGPVGGQWAAFNIRAEDNSGVRDSLFLVLAIPGEGERILLFFALGDSIMEPGSESTIELESFGDMESEQGVLHARLSVRETGAEFDTCADCRGRREEPGIRSEWTLVCAEDPNIGEQQCVILKTALEVVNPGAVVDSEGERELDDSDARQPYALSFRVVSSEQIELSLRSGNLPDDADVELGVVAIEDLGGQGRRARRL